MSWLKKIRDPKNIWDFSKLTTDEIVQRHIALTTEWDAHKFRKGESYDRYLDKLLKKHGLSLAEYYAGNEIAEGC